MNKERILELADKIENTKHDPSGSYFNGINGFTMSYYADTCGSPGCIAGWCVHEFQEDGENVLKSKHLSIFEHATTLLDLNKDTAKMLFEPECFKQYSWIKPREAATTLRKLAETGKVDWSHAADYVND